MAAEDGLQLYILVLILLYIYVLIAHLMAAEDGLPAALYMCPHTAKLCVCLCVCSSSSSSSST